jgi:Questin oxidase-like
MKANGVMRAPSYSSLDDALEVLADRGIELSNGNSNHAPMVAEALCAMGRPDAVTPWLARYRERMMPRPASSGPIASENWRDALGRRERFTDWAEFFRQEQELSSWRGVLDCWIPRLAPGFSAAATHGVIRVGHAVRSLRAAETSCRLQELADALASWASTYRELPTDGAATGSMPPHEAIAKVPIIPPKRRGQRGNITASLAMLDDVPEFPRVIGLIEVGGDIDRVLTDLTSLFARMYHANAHDVLTTIVFIHGVTSLAALGSIIPEVREESARLALRYAWQSGCGLYACFGTGTPLPSDEVERPEGDEDELIDRAIANGDEHVIKFTEACLRRYALDPSPAYLAAAHHALATIRPR